jgi:RNA polymerase sigma-70 factor (ECF subfamily)
MQEKERQFLESYDLYADALFRFAYFQVSDKETATDIIQDVFMETWKYLAAGGEIGNIRAFLYRAAKNRIIDHYRKHRSLSLDALEEEGLDIPDKKRGESANAEIEVSHLLRLFEKVEKKYREPVLLRYVEGLGVKEVADIIGETENNTSVLIHRGIEQLKQLAHI